MTKKIKKINIAILLGIILLSGGFFTASRAKAEPDKQYRSGQIIAISGRNYLIASNKEFAEIIEIGADNKLTQVSEVHGSDTITDLYAGKYLNKYFLVSTTGRYLYRYDLSDPTKPKIEFRRDMYTFKRGQFRIGSINLLAGNNNYIFGAGSNGVRSFYPDNLFINKIYTFDKSYGAAANDNYLYVITETKGQVYDILSGSKLAEVDLENKDKINRTPAFDDSGNAYFPTDRGLVKINIFSQQSSLYANPVPATDIFSYAATVLAGGNVYYANGHGITIFDSSLFKKIKFSYSTKGSGLGASPWAVGITSAKIGSKEYIVDFNKSSIVLYDKNLKVLSVYGYKKLYPDFVTIDLKITPSISTASSGEKINLQIFGFWPNENVLMSFGDSKFNVTVDNQGYASFTVIVPTTKSRETIIQAAGNDSKLNYQTVFKVL